MARVEVKTEGSITLDLNDVAMEIGMRALKGLRESLTHAEGRAKKYVPVRAIFRRTRRGKEFPRTIANPKPGKMPVTAQVMRTYRRAGINTAEQFERFKRSLAPNKRIDVPQPPVAEKYERDKQGFIIGKTLREEYEIESRTNVPLKGVTRGHNNSLQPVFRKGESTFTGDYRLYKAGRLVNVTEAYKVGNGKVKFRPAEIESLLTSRGRNEIKSGRAAYKKPGDEESRLGGTLLGSIHIEGPTAEGRGKIYGYVVAGGKEAYYARYQEFGTVHNRAHPFLRPALYETRQFFKDAVWKAIGPNQFKAAKLKARVS